MERGILNRSVLTLLRALALIFAAAQLYILLRALSFTPQPVMHGGLKELCELGFQSGIFPDPKDPEARTIGMTCGLGVFNAVLGLLLCTMYFVLDILNLLKVVSSFGQRFIAAVGIVTAGAMAILSLLETVYAIYTWIQVLTLNNIEKSLEVAAGRFMISTGLPTLIWGIMATSLWLYDLDVPSQGGSGRSKGQANVHTQQ